MNAVTGMMARRRLAYRETDIPAMSGWKVVARGRSTPRLTIYTCARSGTNTVRLTVETDVSAPDELEAEDAIANRLFAQEEKSGVELDCQILVLLEQSEFSEQLVA